jgi:inosine-uridine nucleoside N-ribohydrolase
LAPDKQVEGVAGSAIDPEYRDVDRIRLLTRRPGDGPDEALPRMVLDTDTFNEVDDQFALVHALLSPDRVNLEAVYAAPFHNEKSLSPGDGMRKSYDEIRRVLALAGNRATPVLEGATEWLSEAKVARPYPATEDLVSRALSDSTGPLFVVAIGAPTNISNAVLLAPEIVARIVVVWLGGHSLHWPTAREFNLQQDLYASQVLLNSGVALVHVPCVNVADHLITTKDEIDHFVRPAGKLGEFLAQRYAENVEDDVAVSKVLWDLAAVGWLLDPSWSTTVLTHSPVLTDSLTWSRDPRRHLIGEVVEVRRDAIFADLFERLTSHSSRQPPLDGWRDRF